LILHGDALATLRTLPDAVAQTCVTSPPYYGLRDYGAAGQIGLEQSPEEYIARLVDVFREVRRVLCDGGTLWVVIGDSYAHSTGGRGDSERVFIRGNGKPYRVTQKHDGRRFNRGSSGYKPKDLIGVPWMLAFALRADGWYLRQDIIWNKPNPMPESVRDRCTRSHEYIFLLSKSRHYYFDAAAIAEPCADSTLARINQDIALQSGSFRQPGKGRMRACPPRYCGKEQADHPVLRSRTKSGNVYHYRPLRNKRDVWTVTTKPYSGAHFAVFPQDLILPCILAGSRPGDVVLDPFFGTGTTGLVASVVGRRYIGIELNPDYITMARDRLGVFAGKS